jgi:hypothetical protein
MAARRQVGVVVAVGVVLRIAWAAYAARTPVGLHDPGLYQYLAESIARGDGYRYPDGPTAYYPIGYPAALAAAVFVLPGSATFAAVVLNVVAAGVAVVATYAFARHWSSHRRSLAAAAVMAVLPNLVFHAALTMGETVFLALLTAGLALLPRRVLLGGLLLGLATLVRPVVLPLLVVLPFLWADRRWKRTALAGAAVLALLVPWVGRNVAVMDSATISTNTGDNLCISRQPGATGGFQLSEFCSGGPANDEVRPQSEVHRDADARHKATAFVREHPLTELSLWPRRVANSFAGDADGLRVAESFGEDEFVPTGLRTVLSFGAGAAFFALLALAVAGAVRGGLPRPAVAFLALGVVAVVVVPSVAFFGDPRFKVPGIPFLAVLAAATPRRLTRP